jgi:fatty-acyl-CoA synthase
LIRAEESIISILMADPVSKSNIEMQTRVLKILRQLLVELGSQHALRHLSVNSQLDRELGLGSLERLELLERLEKEFTTVLPDEAYGDARTPADLAAILLNAVLGIGRKISLSIDSNQPAAYPMPSGQIESLSANQKGVDRQFDPAQVQTLGEVLKGYAEVDPHRVHVQLYLEDDSVRPLTYGQLFSRSLAVAGKLVDRGLKPGQTVAIMLPTSLDFFFSFFGTLLAGCIPVPIYPPFRVDRLEEYAGRQSRSLVNAEVRLLITFRRAEKLARLLQPAIPSLMAVANFEEFGLNEWVDLPLRAGSFEVEGMCPVRAEDIALIQYTSGSTGDPKGVVLTQGNMMANIRAIGAGINVQKTDKAVSWLPLYHDMGLIGSWLAALYFGVPIAILSPLAFLSRPERWLWAIHHHRATISPAPNFAYELCARRIDERAIEGLDLSCWRAALNGAEPVSSDTLSRFTERFKRYGFSPNAFLPVYGLAESSVALTFPAPGKPPRIDRIQRERFQREGIAHSCESIDPSGLRFVSVGRALPGHEIRIVDEDGRPLDERIQGEIQFRGPSTMQGYFMNREATRAVFRGDWVLTGDLGYTADGELFVTGRSKDLIIKGGRNLYPQEIEELTAAVPGVRRGCVAAIGIKDEVLGTERLVIVAETREQATQRKDDLIAAIVAKIDMQMGVPPDQVVLVPPQTVPKTSSGKIRRDACKRMLLNGQLTNKPSPVWWQLVRITLRSWTQRASLGFCQLANVIFGIYAWVIVITFLFLCWATLLPFQTYPKSRIPRKVLRWACRIVLRLTGLFPKIEGAEHLATAVRQSREKHSTFLVVSNHASYLDPLIVASLCPAEIGYVAKLEAASWPIIGRVIRKCGFVLINRNETSQAASDGEQISIQLKERIPMHVFPEGTFTPESGLRPFQMGAFKSAVETGVPTLPLSIRGTRAVFRDGTLLPRRGSVEASFGPLIWPQGKGWPEMVRLREEVRKEILNHCGERSLEIILAGPPR